MEPFMTFLQEITFFVLRNSNELVRGATYIFNKVVNLTEDFFDQTSL